ncbi:MAG: cytochrome b [Alcanivorax sp.]
MKQLDNFDFISRLNHWLVGLGFIGLIAFGFYIANVEFAPGTKGPYMMYHKSLGVLFLAFASWRVLWRIFQGFPNPASDLKTWEHILAKVTHWLLLLSLLIMPISGIVMNLFSGRDLAVFNWFTIPGLNKSEGIAGAANFMHHNAPYLISALILLHVIAALKHHFIDKDATLTRMIKGNRPKEETA